LRPVASVLISPLPDLVAVLDAVDGGAPVGCLSAAGVTLPVAVGFRRGW